MSANLDLVRSIFADWERGDYSSTDWADPDIDLVVIDGPTPGLGRGIPDMVRGMRDYLTAWQGHHTEAEECQELDSERILVMTRESARGKTSGLELSQIRTQGAHLFHIRDGKVTRLAIYWDRDSALADLGLEK
jgi:ketosteroid isomerase-like protein